VKTTPNHDNINNMVSNLDCFRYVSTMSYRGLRYSKGY